MRFIIDGDVVDMTLEERSGYVRALRDLAALMGSRYPELRERLDAWMVSLRTSVPYAPKEPCKT